MGSSSSKPQYYPQNSFPVQAPYTYPSQPQFGYYYQQVGKDPTKVQAIPGYYYPAGVQRPIHRRQASEPIPSNPLPRPPQPKHRVSDQNPAAPAPSSPAAPPAPPVETTETAETPADLLDATQQQSQDAPPEAPAGTSAPGNEAAESSRQPEPSQEPAPAQVDPQSTKPLPSSSQDVFEKDPRRHVRRAHTTGTPSTWHHHGTPSAFVPRKPHNRSQYRPREKEILRLPKPHEELKRIERKPSSTGGGVFRLLRSFTISNLPKGKSKKTPPYLYQPGVGYTYPPSRSGSQSSKPMLNTARGPPVLSGHPISIPLHSPLNPTSAHKVLYKKKLYPTAAHLFEAHKFLKYSPELAERIRTSGNSVVTMSMLARDFQADGKVRKDWSLVWRDKMDEVLYMKFTQHPDLRAELMATGFAPLLDGNETRRPDAEGVNELGKALVRLRERLRKEGAR